MFDSGDIEETNTDIETKINANLNREDILDKKMGEYVLRRNHLNFQKKEDIQNTRIYWKKKYCKRGRKGHKILDKMITFDREVKFEEQNEIKYFIFIKEVAKPNQKETLIKKQISH